VVAFTSDSDNSASASAASAATAAVTDIAPTVTTPTISGTAQEGQTLTASAATTNDADAVVHYQWERSTNGFATFTTIGSDSLNYVVTEADEGATIRVAAVTSDSDNSTSATANSAATAAVTDIAPTLTVPAISGTPLPGQTLTAVGAVTNDSDAVIHYQWQESADNFASFKTIGSDSASYVVGLSNAGYAIRVIASTSDSDNGNASASQTSNSLAVNPIIVAGADVNYKAGPGTSVLLDSTIVAINGTNLTGATVTIDGGSQPGDILSANTAGTNIHASYTNGVLTLTGSDTALDYQNVLGSVSLSSNRSQNGQITIDWQIAEGSFTSNVATSRVELVGNVVATLHSQPSVQAPTSLVHELFADFSAPVTIPNASLLVESTTVGFGSDNFNDFSATHNDLYVVHVDVHPTLADNGAIAFDLPLGQLSAALDGDLVSVTASLADGRPLPAWLQFNRDTGRFAGVLPDDIATGSVPPGGDGGITRHDYDPNAPQTLSQSITIEVLARDSKGKLAITDFTIDLSALKPHNTDKHGWNVLPGDGAVDPFATNRRGRDHVIDLAALATGRDVAPLHAMDHVLWRDLSALDTDRAHGNHGNDPVPAGRAGLSDQIKGLGWRAATAERMALLDSLRQGVSGWR
jgi:hypothetical protein